MARDEAGSRLIALDGLRGLAALCVVAYHLRAPLGGAIAPGGDLAVDLFFLLSGLVLARSYDARFAAGLKPLSFLRARLLRLYPLYGLGLAISFLFVATNVYRPGVLGEILVSFATGALFLPTPMPLSYDPRYMFPANIPAWSLFFELLVNLAFAATALLLTRRRLLMLIGAAAGGLAVCALVYGTLEGGAAWAGIHVGALRVIFSFFLGVYIARFRMGARRHGAWRATAGAALLLFPLLLPAPTAWRGLFDLAVVLAIWPLLVGWASRIELDGVSRSIATGLGDASYALYALHLPLLNWAVAGSEAAFGLGWGEQPLMFAIVFIPFALAVAWSANRLFDGPARRLLEEALRRRPRLAA